MTRARTEPSIRMPADRFSAAVRNRRQVGWETRS